MDSNYSLSDLAALMKDNDGFTSGNGLLFLLFILILFGGGIGLNNRNGELNQWATAAGQNELLLGQKFDALGQKVNQIGDGLCSSTYALNNAIKDGNAAVANQVITEGRAVQAGMCELKTAIHAEGEATRAMIQQNKIETLQAQVNELKTAQMMCGTPKISPYLYNVVPNCGCGCSQ